MPPHTSRGFSSVALLFILLSACTPSAAPSPTVRPVPSSTPVASTPVSPTETSSPTPAPAPHRIGIRVVDGTGEFYDRLTGEKFVPRGNNYIRIAEQVSVSGQTMVYHSTFNVGLYDPGLADEALRHMRDDGYNVVRVFVQGNCRASCIGDPSGGLSAAYIANVVDFLDRARANDIFVILTTDAEPQTRHYINLLDSTWSEQFSPPNSYYLRGGGILVATEFWQDLVEELIRQNAPLDAIFAYALRNELFFEANSPPLSLSSGQVDTADGRTYDMASADDRDRMLQENLVLWIDNVRAAILRVDPTALVTVGFFVPHGPNPARVGDSRLAITAPVIWESQADFIDLHPYPGFGLPLDQYEENFGMEGMRAKPIIMGEFGAARSSYPSASSASRALRAWQVESCNYGFDGWLLWTWDTEDPFFYDALTGEGEINRELAPINRPDPCAPSRALP